MVIGCDRRGAAKLQHKLQRIVGYAASLDMNAIVAAGDRDDQIARFKLEHLGRVLLLFEPGWDGMRAILLHLGAMVAPQHLKVASRLPIRLQQLQNIGWLLKTVLTWCCIDAQQIWVCFL